MTCCNIAKHVSSRFIKGDGRLSDDRRTWDSDASDWSSVKSGEIWNLRLCLEKCQSEEVYDQAASAAGSNGNDGNYGISCLVRGDSSILQRSRLGTRKSSWHWGWERSISVSFLIRTSGKEYHSQAGSTSLMKKLACPGYEVHLSKGHFHTLIIRPVSCFVSWHLPSPNDGVLVWASSRSQRPRWERRKKTFLVGQNLF